MWLDNRKIAVKVALIVVASFIGMCLIFAGALNTLDAEVLAGRKTKIQNLIQSADAMVRYFHNEAAAGRMSEANAKAAALTILASSRYGNDDYFWVHDVSNHMVMHPVSPELNGRDLDNIHDNNGIPVFVGLTTAARSSPEGGFYFYDWPKPHSQPSVSKVSYVKLFEPWGWVIGTGIYLDDVQSAFWSRAMIYGGLMLLVTLSVLAFSLIISRRITRPIGALCTALGALADQDLTVDIPLTDRLDEIGDMARASAWLSLHLHDVVLRVEQNASEVSNAVEEISTAINAQAPASNQMSASVAEITSTMEELSASSTQVADYSTTVVDIANRTWESSRIGADAMQDMLIKMTGIRSESHHSLAVIEDLGVKSKEISKIMQIIENVADQTKLIAFNAALEASSAGEAGRRFGVVATEIRRLADSVTESTGEISKRVGEIQDSISHLVVTSEKASLGIEAGMTESAQAAQRLSEVVESAHESSNAAKQISFATQQQRTASSQVVAALREIVSASANSARSVNRISDVAGSMSGLSSELRQLVGGFTLRRDTGDFPPSHPQ